MLKFRCLFFLMTLPGSIAFGDLFVGFLSYTGHFNKDALGTCCSGPADAQRCTQPCNLLFDVSVLDSNGKPTGERQRPSGLPLRSYHDDLIFPMPFLSDEFINPLKFGLNMLTADLMLSVQVYDVDPESLISVTSQDVTFQLVDNMTFSMGLHKPSDFYDCRDVQGYIRSGTRLKLALRFSCHTLYAGDDCATDCLRFQRSKQCLNQAVNLPDTSAQIHWSFGSPLGRCPAVPQKPSMVLTTISQTMTLIPSHIAQTTPTLIMTERFNSITDNVNTQTDRMDTVIVSNDITSSMYSATSAVKTNIFTLPYSTHTLSTDTIATFMTTQLYVTETTGAREVYSDMSSYLYVTRTINTDAVKTDVTSGLHESQTNAKIEVKTNGSSDVYSDSTSHLYVTRTVNTDAANTGVASGFNEPQTKASTTLQTDATSDISPTFTGASAQTLNPSTVVATEIISSAFIPINSNMVTSLSTSDPDLGSTETAFPASMTTTGVSNTLGASIPTSFTVVGTGTTFIGMNSETVTTLLPSLTTLIMETSSTHKATPMGASTSESILMSSSSSFIATAATKATNNNMQSPTVSVLGTTPNSEATSQKSETTKVITSPKPRTPERPQTTNKIVQPTVLDDSTSSRDPMQFWAIIVGSVLGGLAIVGILGYVIYRSRQKALQKRQEIYTVTPQITSMIEENGTSGRSDVPMTTALL